MFAQNLGVMAERARVRVEYCANCSHPVSFPLDDCIAMHCRNDESAVLSHFFCFCNVGCCKFIEVSRSICTRNLPQSLFNQVAQPVPAAFLLLTFTQFHLNRSLCPHTQQSCVQKREQCYFSISAMWVALLAAEQSG